MAPSRRHGRPPSEPRASAPALAPPRHGTLWAILVFALCTLALAYPALAGKFLVSTHSDQYLAGYAFREFAASSLKSGHGFPLWNPYLMSGVPYVAAMAGDIFYPTFLLRWVLPTDVAMTWSFILHVFLAGLFTYAFLRRWGVGYYGAVVGGVAYMLTGFVASQVSPGHDGKLYVSALFPLVLWLILASIRDGRRWAYGLSALTVGAAVLSPHPQLLQYMLLASGAFALFIAFGGEGEHALPRPVALRRLAMAFGALVVGALIGAVQFLPVREYVAWSPRATGMGWERAVSYSFPPEELINTYLPQFSGILDAYWGRNGIHLHSEYLGVIVMVLAGLGFASWRRRFVAFWLITGCVALLWSLGGFTPFYHLVYAIIPGTKYFRAPSTMFFVTSFAVAVFAAYGMERVVAREVTVRYAVGWLIAAGVIALLATAGALVNVGAAILPQQYELVQDNATAVTLGGWRSFVAVGLACGVLILLVRGVLQPALAGWILIGLAALDLWSIERLYWSFSPPASVLYAADATVDYLTKLQRPARVFAYPLQQEGLAPHDPFLLGNGLMVHRVRSVWGYHGNELGRYRRLDGYEEGGNQFLQRVLLNANFQALVNLEYFLTNVDSLPIPGAQKVAGPTRDAAGTMISLYRLVGDHPPAWVTPVIVKAGDEAVLATVLDARFDIHRAALFDSASAVQGVQPTSLPQPLAIPVTISRYEPGHIALDLAQGAPAGAALIVSENYYPGWQATVDGKAAPTARADYTLIGVALPPGGKHVDLSFHSQTYRRGVILTVVALALAIAWVLAGATLGRRRAGD